MSKRDCDIFLRFSLCNILCYRGGGVYSNDHLNISHPMDRGALTSIDLLANHLYRETYRGGSCFSW